MLELYRPGDVVWVHDYHLMLLPSVLRARHPNMKIGFFSHVPFPSSEIYRVLPFRKELLEGLLSSSLIGFQTHDYLRHFKNTTVRLLKTDGKQFSRCLNRFSGRFGVWAPRRSSTVCGKDIE